MNPFRTAPTAILITLLCTPWIFGTSPLPPPYHQYRVSGYIERQGGGPKENYVVTLAGKFPFIAPDSVIDIADFYSGSIDQCVTDTGGYFFLDVRGPGKADSVTVKISAVDKLPYISPSWLIPGEPESIFGETTYREPGCSGCGTNETSAGSSVIGYRYSFQIQHIIIPD